MYIYIADESFSQKKNLHPAVRNINPLLAGLWSSHIQFSQEFPFLPTRYKKFLIISSTHSVTNLSYWRWNFGVLGPLVKSIVADMVSKRDDATSKKRFQIYSAHDTTISTLLNTIGLFNPPHQPPYAAMVLIELRERFIDGKAEHLVTVSWYSFIWLLQSLFVLTSTF